MKILDQEVRPSGWRSNLPQFSFFTQAMRLFGAAIVLVSLFPAGLAMFAILQPLIGWLNPAYVPFGFFINDELATSIGAFATFAWVAFCFNAVAAVLLLPTFHEPFRTWLKALTSEARAEQFGPNE